MTMEITQELIDKIRSLNQGNTLRINGTDYQVVDVQVLPEPRFELKQEKETKDEGIEIYLAGAEKEIEDPPLFSADYRLTMVDYTVEYELVEEREGIHELSKEYSHDHLIVHDYENGKTSVYKSEYVKKDIGAVKIRLLDLDENVIKLESMEF